MTTLSDLIARLESAKEGNRELDAEIARAVGFVVITAVLPISPENWQVKNPKQPGVTTWDLRKYTTSLDAAMTLVPNGWGFNIHSSPPEHNCCQSASLMRGEPPYFDTEEVEASAATCIIALCIAALEAREAAR